MAFSHSAPKYIVSRKDITVGGSASSGILQPKWSNSPRQVVQSKKAAAITHSPRQVAQSKNAAQLLRSPGQHKPVLQAYWAAKKRHTNGKELRYWNQGTEDAGRTRRQGWYSRDFFGGWGESAAFVSDGPLDLNATGVEALSRIAPVSTPSNHISVVEERTDFFAVGAGRERSGRSTRGMPQHLQVERFSEIVSWCQNVDNLIDLFEKNETDVTMWRNRLGALSGAQIALGLVGSGLIIAGIVATGGLAAIPMAAGGIAIAASSAAAGVGVGAARSVAERGLANAQREGGVQHGRAVVGGSELAKGAGAIGAKEGMTRGLMAATEVGAAQAVGAAAGGGGAAISVVKGGMGLYKAVKVDVGAIWAQVDWTKAQQNIADAERFLDRHSGGFNATMVAQVKQKLNGTREKILASLRK